MNTFKKTLAFIVIFLIFVAGGAYAYINKDLFFKIASKLPPITAVVHQDLVDDAGNTTYVIAKFYAGDIAISNYFAIPIENIGLDPAGNYGVSIYTKKENDNDVKYIAQIFELADSVSASINSKDKIDVFGTQVSYGDACFSTKSNAFRAEIVPCTDNATLDLSLPIGEEETDDQSVPEDYPIDEISDEELKALGVWAVEESTTTEDSVEVTTIEDSQKYTAIPQPHQSFDIEVNTSENIVFGSK